MTERFDGGRLIAAVGAVALLVSLFLDWYGPGELGLGSAITAWTAFEITDLLLAVISIAALLGMAAITIPSAPLPQQPRNSPAILGGVAFVLVALNLINVPPAANGASLETGAWIALAGSALMLIGGVLAVTRISFVVSLAPRERTADRPPVEEEPGPYGVDLGSEAIGAEETQPMPTSEEERS